MEFLAVINFPLVLNQHRVIISRYISLYIHAPTTRRVIEIKIAI